MDYFCYNSKFNNLICLSKLSILWFLSLIVVARIEFSFLIYSVSRVLLTPRNIGPLISNCKFYIFILMASIISLRFLTCLLLFLAYYFTVSSYSVRESFSLVAISNCFCSILILPYKNNFCFDLSMFNFFIRCSSSSIILYCEPSE
jgi:hypothetical protein